MVGTLYEMVQNVLSKKQISSSLYFIVLKSLGFRVENHIVGWFLFKIISFFPIYRI